MTSIQYHLVEIKWRVFYLLFSTISTFFVCYKYPIEIIYIIGKPFLEHQQTFIFLDLTEAFYTLLKISFIFTILICVPLGFYHTWCFLIPSSYKSERKNIHCVFLLIFCLFTSEIGVSYFFLFPKICDFLLSFEITSQTTRSSFGGDPVLTVEFAAQIGAYVTLILKFMIGIFIFFQLPVGVCFLYSKNILDVSWFYNNRKFLTFFSLIVSSFVVPPDVIIQFLMSLVFIFLFELLIFFGLIFEQYKKTN